MAERADESDTGLGCMLAIGLLSVGCGVGSLWLGWAGMLIGFGVSMLVFYIVGTLHAQKWLM